MDKFKRGDRVTLSREGVTVGPLNVIVPPSHEHAKVTLYGFRTVCLHDLVDDGWTIIRDVEEVS